MCTHIFRGENGAGGFVMLPLPEDPNKCIFMWFVNSDLKVIKDL